MKSVHKTEQKYFDQLIDTFRDKNYVGLNQQCSKRTLKTRV